MIERLSFQRLSFKGQGKKAGLGCLGCITAALGWSEMPPPAAAASSVRGVRAREPGRDALREEGLEPRREPAPPLEPPARFPPATTMALCVISHSFARRACQRVAFCNPSHLRFASGLGFGP